MTSNQPQNDLEMNRKMNRVKGTSKTSCNRKGLWTSRQIPECVQIGNHLIPGKSRKDGKR